MDQTVRQVRGEGGQRGAPLFRVGDAGGVGEHLAGRPYLVSEGGGEQVRRDVARQTVQGCRDQRVAQLERDARACSAGVGGVVGRLGQLPCQAHVGEEARDVAEAALGRVPGVAAIFGGETQKPVQFAGLSGLGEVAAQVFEEVAVVRPARPIIRALGAVGVEQLLLAIPCVARLGPYGAHVVEEKVVQGQAVIGVALDQ